MSSQAPASDEPVTIERVARAPAPLLPEGPTSELKQWIVRGTELQELGSSEVGEFFSADSYVVQYSYSSGSDRKSVIFFWLGRDSAHMEKGTAAARAVELAQSLGGGVPQVRVVQGKEPPQFTALFKGAMLIHYANRGDAFEHTRLYHIRGTEPRAVKAIQVAVSAAALNSGDCFALVQGDVATVWCGSGSSTEERNAVVPVAGRLAPHVGYVEEGAEPAEFWEALGGYGACARDMRLCSRVHAHGRARGGL